MTKTCEVYDLQKDPAAFWESLERAGKLRVRSRDMTPADWRKAQKAAREGIKRDAGRRKYTEPMLDRFAEKFCDRAHKRLSEWEKNERKGWSPSKNRIAMEIHDGVRSEANRIANLALTPDRLERLGITNPLAKD